ncbi:uncharacterized protein [Haliotis asinina]|uniref:uncharacterized protein n=1 Tax=Haliotis asinina TaxID=109174 RepID=UPI0035327456
MVFRIALACLLVAMATASTPVGSCVSTTSPDYRKDPDDCSVYYLCVNNNLYKYECSNLVFDPWTQTCASPGSIYDSCTETEKETEASCPPESTALIPHPSHCAQYFNCSASKHGYFWPEHLRECPYPQLYNDITKQCEHYTMVDCGDRFEPTAQCDYRGNQCEAAHCRPCYLTYPVCKGLPDGLNQWVGMSDSAYFAVCVDERMVYSGMCSQEHGRQIFDKVKRMCIEIA